MALYLETAPAIVSDQNAKLWARYDAQQRAERGLKPGDSLDKRNGVVLPLAQAVTTGANGYVLSIQSADRAIAAIRLDSFALSQDGIGGINLSAAKDESALDPRLRTALAGASAADAAKGDTR